MPGKTIVISFDMETDIGSWTSGDRGMKEGTPEILSVLANHKVPATFLFTGREATNHPDAVERVLAGGHEIGCHTMYHETIGEAVFSMPGDLFVLNNEVRGRLELATGTVEKVAGIRPISFRAPRLFGSTTMINALEDLGYIADSSFPAYYYARDFLPYRPSREDWSKDGDMRIIEVPVFYNACTDQDDETHRERDQWPMLRLRGGKWFADLCSWLLENVKDEDGNSVLCVYLHPWEFAPMPSQITTDEASVSFKPFLHQNCGDYTTQALDEFIGLMRADAVSFATLGDLARDYLERG